MGDGVGANEAGFGIVVGLAVWNFGLFEVGALLWFLRSWICGGRVSRTVVSGASSSSSSTTTPSTARVVSPPTAPTATTSASASVAVASRSAGCLVIASRSSSVSHIGLVGVYKDWIEGGSNRCPELDSLRQISGNRGVFQAGCLSELVLFCFRYGAERYKVGAGEEQEGNRNHDEMVCRSSSRIKTERQWGGEYFKGRRRGELHPFQSFPQIPRLLNFLGFHWRHWRGAPPSGSQTDLTGVWPAF